MDTGTGFTLSFHPPAQFTSSHIETREGRTEEVKQRGRWCPSFHSYHLSLYPFPFFSLYLFSFFRLLFILVDVEEREDTNDRNGMPYLVSACLPSPSSMELRDEER